MRIEACYEALGGDYQDVSKRLPTQKMIEKFIGKFLQDDSYSQLCAAFAAGNCEESFRAAHTLKGVAGNLGFTRLMHSASLLTEALREKSGPIPEASVALLEDVKQDYDVTTGAIRAYLSEK
ncbi:MAG: Hpt domain-containing protein [Bacillota bacterium]|nr:Hpt domain-containing protein [Bacillota bacterium]